MKKLLLPLLLSFATVGITYAQDADKQLKAYHQPLVPIKADTSIASLLYGSKLAEKAQTEKLKNDWAATQQLATSQYYNSNMPIASHSVQDLDTMPIAKPGDRNTKYTMMVKRISYAKRTPSKAKPETLPEAAKEK